jgi:hypothetical protein
VLAHDRFATGSEGVLSRHWDDHNELFICGSGDGERVAPVPYELSLEPDHDRGGHVYSAVVSGELEPAAVRELSDWVSDAKQNPDASFVIDLSQSTCSARTRLELRSLIRRHADLQATRRLSVRVPRRRSAAAAAA